MDGEERTGPARHLAIRANNWVGDLVMATPVLLAAREHPAWARLSILVREHLAPLLNDGPLAEHVVTLPAGSDEVESYRTLRPDALLLLTNSLGAAWRAFRAGVPIRAGAALGPRRWLLTHAVLPPRRAARRVAVPTAHLLRDLAGLVGVLPADLQPRLWVREQLLAETRDGLAALGLERGAGYVLCCPGAAFGAAKLWPPESFAHVLDRLWVERGWRGVLSGAPGERQLLEAVAERAEHSVISLAGQPGDLESLKALVARAQLLLVGDSGPRWVAAALDTPCVSVMGPNFPELTATALERCAVVRVEDLDCSPCLRRRCPLGHHRCMSELDPERVLEAAHEVLA